MAKFCGKCGAKLDEATGLCPNCDADKLNERSEKPESVETPKPKQDMVSESEKPLSKKEAKKKRKADKKAAKKARKKEKWAAMTTGQKARRFFLRLIATLLVASILVVGILGALGYFGVVDIPIVNSILANLNITKKGTQLNSLDADETYFIVNQEASVKFTVNADGSTESVNLCTEDNKVIHKMNDDGLNGDDVANDGIYTYILTTKSIQATSMTYHAVADGCASNEVSIFFFEPLTAETATEAENLFKDTQETLVRIEKKYTDDSGYISSDSIPNIMSEAKQYLDVLFSDGKILVLEYGDESIYIKFASGLTLVYEPTIEGVSSGGNDISLTFSAYQPNPDIFAQGISDLADALANDLSSVSSTYHADEVTLSRIKSLPANQVVLWNGHGGYGPIVKSYLASGEYFDWSAWWLDTTGYYWDCVQDRIIMRSTEKQYNLACFTSKFVDHYCGDLSNDLIILASCHSGQNSKLADAFLEKGATAVLGFTDTVYTSYCQNVTAYTLLYMTYINESTDTYYTLSDALARAQSELGDNDEEFALKYPEVFTEIKSETASPIIFGGENAENYSFSVQIENSRLSEDDIPSGAEEFNGHYYYLYDLDTVTTWAQAKEYCESQGGYLATITSQEENKFLYSYITDMGYDSVLFGLFDTDQNNMWAWVTGEPFSYENWASGEPNHQGGYEHYGMYYEKNKDGTWNDGSGKTCPFLCEWGEYQAIESATGIWEELIKSGKYTEYTKDWDQLNQMGISVVPTEYAILDIDGDGWEELILSGYQENISEFGYYSVLACNKESKEITVIPIESPAQVLSGPVGQNFQGLQYSSQYHTLMYTELNNGSMFGDYNFMALDNNEIKLAFSVGFQCDSDTNIRSYSMKEDGNSTAISEEEYDQYMEESKPIEFKPIPEPEPVRTTSDERDIVLVLDTSGSMSGTPMEETKKAATNFVNTILEEDASIGIVAYEDSAERLSDFSVDKNHLTGIVADISSGGGTNIESGLAEAKSMLDSSNAKKKIIVLMSDGEPNEGKEGEELIAYADEIKNSDTLIYTLGFFENMGGNKSSAQYLMEHLASEGCHYEVASADDLVFFFEDMADQINGQKYIYIRIACPVDVTVTYNGETLCSAEGDLNVRTDFGTLTFEDSENEMSVNEDDRIKVLRLKEGADYDVQIVGTGRGMMDYTIGFMDENSDYSDFRRFEDIKITKQTVIDTVAAVSDESVLNIDEDGDGKYDLKLRAEENGYGEEIKTPVWIYVGIGGGMVLLLIVVLVMVKIRKGKKKGMVKS